MLLACLVFPARSSCGILCYSGETLSVQFSTRRHTVNSYYVVSFLGIQGILKQSTEHFVPLVSRLSQLL